MKASTPRTVAAYAAAIGMFFAVAWTTVAVLNVSTYIGGSLVAALTTFKLVLES